MQENTCIFYLQKSKKIVKYEKKDEEYYERKIT